jgi:tetratricopeptide (TPR) repeat protein
MLLYEQALVIAREIDERMSEARSLQGIGMAYRGLENYQQAIHYIEQAMAVHKTIEDREQWTIVYYLGLIADIYQRLDAFEKATSYYEQGLAFARQLGNQEEEAFILRFKTLKKQLDDTSQKHSGENADSG